MGDSYTFGMGVEDREAWPYLLNRKIQIPRGYREIQVINAGVCGYNLRQYEALLTEKVLPLSPKMIIIGLMSNDLKRTYAFEDGYIVFPKVKGTIPIPGKRWLQTHSYLYQYLVLRYHQIRDGFSENESKQDHKKEQVRRSSDWLKAAPLFNKIVQSSREQSAKLICVRFMFKEEAVSRICEGLEIPFIDVELGNGMFLPDGHPNREGHKSIANQIANGINPIVLETS